MDGGIKFEKRSMWNWLIGCVQVKRNDGYDDIITGRCVWERNREREKQAKPDIGVSWTPRLEANHKMFVFTVAVSMFATITDTMIYIYIAIKQQQQTCTCWVNLKKTFACTHTHTHLYNKIQTKQNKNVAKQEISQLENWTSSTDHLTTTRINEWLV